MGWDQWCAIRIHNFQDEVLIVRNARIEWGKYYMCPDKDNVVNSESLEHMRIPKGGEGIVAARGDGPWSGTEGKFDLFTPNGHITTIEFSSPYSSKEDNRCHTGWVNPDFVVERTAIDRRSKKPLGNVVWRVGRKPQELPQNDRTDDGYWGDSDDDSNTVHPKGPTWDDRVQGFMDAD